MKKMLIAIDSEIFIEALERTSCGKYEIRTCCRGNEALNLITTMEPDVLIIDYSLPSINGLEVLKQASFRPQVIIALTNYLSDRIVQESQATGVKALIRHPCSLDSILSYLDSLQ